MTAPNDAEAIRSKIRADVSLCNMAEAELHEGEEHLADEVCWEQGATTLQQDTDNRVPGNRIETASLVGFNSGWST